ncbi:uncharacterized protein HKW66_Vig0258480 [Vigna angularis]|uniref:Uncharacterized protein n=2 Tax=Phaseolus angularis TaxID=3914 RepID=A0A8T0LGA9_PHAAN|nr:uncharacterized protein LOC108328273 isoform X1 [Vigna angularis]KAG2411117.1 uncharacterized protein HKW66_Vig0258480 [Vigna angularis]BAT72695.1 hypothetical protein VIGAN_01012500 [Vigna angularis var. angularis]
MEDQLAEEQETSRLSSFRPSSSDLSLFSLKTVQHCFRFYKEGISRIFLLSQLIGTALVCDLEDATDWAGQTVKGSTTIVEGFPQSKAHHPHKVFPLSNFAAELLQALPSFHSKVVMHWSLWCCILLVLDEVDEFLSFNSQ